MAARILLLLTPVLMLFPGALLATGHRTGSLICLLIVGVGARAIVRWHAKQNNRDADLWGWGAFVFPMITPVVLALLPEDPNSAGAMLRAGGDGGHAIAAKGPFVERFPLLTQCLEGQPDLTRAGIVARFKSVKSNFEFLLPTRPEAVTRLLADAQRRGLEVWTGSDGKQPIIYGAGMVRPGKLDETANWLAASGAPGGKLTIAHRDRDGTLRFAEHRFEAAPPA